MSVFQRPASQHDTQAGHTKRISKIILQLQISQVIYTFPNYALLISIFQRRTSQHDTHPDHTKSISRIIPQKQISKIIYPFPFYKLLMSISKAVPHSMIPKLFTRKRLPQYSLYYKLVRPITSSHITLY